MRGKGINVTSRRPLLARKAFLGEELHRGSQPLNFTADVADLDEWSSRSGKPASFIRFSRRVKQSACRATWSASLSSCDAVSSLLCMAGSVHKHMFREKHLLALRDLHLGMEDFVLTAALLVVLGISILCGLVPTNALLETCEDDLSHD
jgi:hypothetical protein